MLFCLSPPTFLSLIPLNYCITSYFGWQLRWYPGQELSCGCAAWRGAETCHSPNFTSEMILKENMLNETAKDKSEIIQLQIVIKTAPGKGNSPLILLFCFYFHQSQKSFLLLQSIDHLIIFTSSGKQQHRSLVSLHQVNRLGITAPVSHNIAQQFVTLFSLSLFCPMMKHWASMYILYVCQHGTLFLKAN